MLKEIFRDKKIAISEVDVNEFHKHLNKYDDQNISDYIHDALASMKIEHCGFQWEINVTVEQEIKK